MKAIFLVAYGDPQRAFEMREVADPVPGEKQVRVKVEAFGLNFADVMARKGLYRDAPPLPCILGYDEVGVIDAVGRGVTTVKEGDRVTSFTRFGGYAEYVVAEEKAVAKIPLDMSPTFATALATHYCTAYYASHEAARVYEGEKVLIHAAAGGVGTALVQLLKQKNALIFGTCSSDEKVEYLKGLGVQHPINYATTNYFDEIRKILGETKLDAVFDSVGGKYTSEGMKLIGAGGRMVCMGGSEFSAARNFFSKWKIILQFGFYHPGKLLMASKSLIAVNMLRIADSKPDFFLTLLDEVISMALSGKIKPAGGLEFPVSRLGEAHLAMEHRKTHGKISIRW